VHVSIAWVYRTAKSACLSVGTGIPGSNSGQDDQLYALNVTKYFARAAVTRTVVHSVEPGELAHNGSAALRDNPFSHRIEDDGGGAVQTKFLHEVGAMAFNSLRAKP